MTGLASTLDALLHRGLYPPLYVREVAPSDWYAAHVHPRWLGAGQILARVGFEIAGPVHGPTEAVERGAIQ